MKAYTIGIDYGTLSGRAVLVNTRDGRELATAAMDYPHGVMQSLRIRTFCRSDDFFYTGS